MLILKTAKYLKNNCYGKLKLIIIKQVTNYFIISDKLKKLFLNAKNKKKITTGQNSRPKLTNKNCSNSDK